jgi:hypothetical protein
MSGDYVPRQSYDDAVKRGNVFHERASTLQARLDTYTVRDAVSEALTGVDPNQSDVTNLKAFLEGSNLRVADDRAIVDFDAGDGKVLTMSPKEAIELMRSQPEKYGNLFDRPKPPEPTKQEVHNAKLAAMTPRQYMAYRQRRGDDFLSPE